jgi:epoxyqueuosine reductase
MDLKLWLSGAAERLGFDLIGIAPADIDAENRDHYLGWLDRGFHGEMGYMKRFERQDLRALMPGVRSVICVGMSYNADGQRSIDSIDPSRAWIARYAWGDDYHAVMRGRLKKLVEELGEIAGPALETRIYVDTGPLLERAFARQAGLGWIAKNTCLINEDSGSWLLLGEVLTNLDLEPNLPPPDRCGTCTSCLEACPTGALTEPYVLDATRCISYYTIEVKGSIPQSMRSQMGRHIFGCDICQDVCPWNRQACVTQLSEFRPRSLRFGETGSEQSTLNPPLDSMSRMSQSEFQSLFRNSPLRRPKYRGFLRNVAVAMGNSGDEKFRPILEQLAKHDDPLIQEHARWALDRLS